MTDEEKKEIRIRQAEIQGRIIQDVITHAEAEDIFDEVNMMVQVMYDTRIAVYEIIDQMRGGEREFTVWEMAKITRLALQILHKIVTDLEYTSLVDRFREEMCPRV
jgi:hypothetical protein